MRWLGRFALGCREPRDTRRTESPPPLARQSRSGADRGSSQKKRRPPPRGPVPGRTIEHRQNAMSRVSIFNRNLLPRLFCKVSPEGPLTMGRKEAPRPGLLKAEPKGKLEEQLAGRQRATQLGQVFEDPGNHLHPRRHAPGQGPHRAPVRNPARSAPGARPPRDLDRILACRYRRVVVRDHTVSIPGRPPHRSPGEPGRTFLLNTGEDISIEHGHAPRRVDRVDIAC